MSGVHFRHFPRTIINNGSFLKDSLKLPRQVAALAALPVTTTTRREKSTCVSLSTSFNSKLSLKSHLSKTLKRGVSATGLFGVPELATPEGFKILEERALEETDRLIAEATAPKHERKRNVVPIFDDISDTLCRVADLADFVRVSHPDARFSSAASNTCASICALVEKLNTNASIYKALEDALKSPYGDVHPMDEMERHVGELFLFDFQQSGIQLPVEQRQRFVEINEAIHMVGNQFSLNATAGRSVSRSILPAHLQNTFVVDGENLVVNGLHSESSLDWKREAAYRLFLSHEPEQDQLLDMLLNLRHELAVCVGFPSYGHRALNNTMIGTPANVNNFLETLAGELKPRSAKELNSLKAIKRKHNGLSPTQKLDIDAWDPPFYVSQARQQKYNIDPEAYSAYFSLGGCMEGLNTLFKSLYNVTLEAEETEPGEVWHPESVQKLAIRHGTEGTLGYIYCDFFERQNKLQQDCHFTICGGRELADGSYQMPVVVVVLNLPKPRWGGLALLTPSMVENLFHEFGHAMHSMFARTKYQHVTGTRCATDFAEVPSVLMEYFASDYRVLSTFARHHKTGETIPEAMVQNLCQSRHMYNALDTHSQVFYSLLDQKYHGPPSGVTTTEILRQCQEKYHCLSYVDGTAWQLRFGHLVNYGAKYYSYVLSRAVATKVWHRCFADDPFSAANGEKWRREVLSHGGSIPPLRLLQSLLGEEQAPIDTRDFVASLLREIDQYASYD